MIGDRVAMGWKGCRIGERGLSSRGEGKIKGESEMEERFVGKIPNSSGGAVYFFNAVRGLCLELQQHYDGGARGLLFHLRPYNLPRGSYSFMYYLVLLFNSIIMIFLLLFTFSFFFDKNLFYFFYFYFFVCPFCIIVCLYLDT